MIETEYDKVATILDAIEARRKAKQNKYFIECLKIVMETNDPELYAIWKIIKSKQRLQRN